MKFNKFIEPVARLGNRVMFSAKKKSPEICLIAGGITLGVGIFMACKKSMHLPEVLTEKDEKLDALHNVEENETGEITVEPSNKEIAKVYGETGLEIAKMYAVPALLIFTGTGFILASHREMSRRNAAVSAAYASLSTAFDTYRQRISEKFGKDADDTARYGIREEVVKTKTTDENGETKTVKEKTLIVENPDESQWARYFTRTNPNWNNDDDYNRMFLNQMQRYMNDLLRSQKYIYMNDIFKQLGVKQCKAGQRFGYRYRKDAKGNANNIEFYVKRVQIPVSSDPKDGYMPALLIDFTTPVDIFSDLTEEDYVGD